MEILEFVLFKVDAILHIKLRWGDVKGVTSGGNYVP